MIANAPLAILCVDDDADIRRIVSLALALDPSITVADAASGEEALALITAAARPFDLFLFDVMMPGMSGLVLMKAVQRSPASVGTPVVLMTASAQSSQVASYLDAGAAGVIVKPFDPMQLACGVRAFHQHPATAAHRA